jgi:septal ring factor EnvC (AmiA/AmiB activator)
MMEEWDHFDPPYAQHGEGDREAVEGASNLSANAVSKVEAPLHRLRRSPSPRFAQGGFFVALLLATALPAAPPDAGIADQQRALAAAKRDAAVAEQRAATLERQARAATRAADRAEAEQAAAAAAIQASEARTAAAQVRITIVDRLRAEQRARLAERQGPIVRLTAALQTMTRRPAALALVEPGSVDDMIHVRALLGSTLPEIRARTAGLRAEVARGDALRRQAEQAVADLQHEQQQLETSRRALARIEAVQRRRSQGFVDDAMAQQDRMIAMGEKAKDIAQLINDLGDQADIRARLASLPGPVLRPSVPGASPLPPAAMELLAAAQNRPPSYRLPVFGQLVTGMGEISKTGIRSRGITLATARRALVVAPANGRIAYAGPFRGYAGIVIIDHDGGWASLVTGLGPLLVKVGEEVIQGSPIGTADGGDPRITVELRHNSVPVDILPIVGR